MAIPSERLIVEGTRRLEANGGISIWDSIIGKHHRRHRVFGKGH